MGDLTQTSFMQAWQGEKFQALRRANLREDVTGTVCEKCVAYEDVDEVERRAHAGATVAGR